MFYHVFKENTLLVTTNCNWTYAKQNYVFRLQVIVVATKKSVDWKPIMTKKKHHHASLYKSISLLGWVKASPQNESI